MIMFVQVCIGGCETNACPIGEEAFAVLFLQVLQVAYYLQHTLLYHFIFHVMWVSAKSPVGHDVRGKVKHILPYLLGHDTRLLPLLPLLINLLARKIIVVFRFSHCLLFLHCLCINQTPSSRAMNLLWTNTFSTAFYDAVFPPAIVLGMECWNTSTKSSGAEYSEK